MRKQALTVEELIAQLESMPQDAEVLVNSPGSFEMDYAKDVYFSEDYGGVIIE